MNCSRALFFIALLTGGAAAQVITFPSSLSVGATSAGGVSFTYSGVLTQAATLGFTASGLSCEQGAAYCTNASGVIVIPGSSGVGATSSFGGTFFGTAQTWNFGALIMGISGVGGVQVFPANSANGLGSGSPPSALSLAGSSLASLGFPAFSVTNPTITFVVADTLYADNSGGFTLTQSAPSATPVPSTLLLAMAALVMLSLMLIARRRRRTD
jgi:hypothetical protein